MIEDEQKDKDQEMWLRCGIVIVFLTMLLMASWLSGLLFWHNIFA